MSIVRPRLIAPALLIAAGLAAPLAAFAQTTPPVASPMVKTTPSVTPTTSTATTSPVTTPVATGVSQKGDNRVENRITDLHRRLKITALQETDWTQFASVMRANAQRSDDAHTASEMKEATISAPDHLRGYAKTAAARADDVQKLVPAFDKLYGDFTPDQKKAADQVFRDDAEHMSDRGGRG